MIARNVNAQTVADLLHYAKADAQKMGADLPDVSGLSPDEATVVLGRFMASSNVFMEGDPNFDNCKRNITIRLFLEYPIPVLRQYGIDWLNRWREANGQCLWFKEWDGIMNSEPDDVLVRILLSSDEDSTRQRSSKPLSGMLSQEVVLRVKRSGFPI